MSVFTSWYRVSLKTDYVAVEDVIAAMNQFPLTVPLPNHFRAWPHDHATKMVKLRVCPVRSNSSYSRFSLYGTSYRHCNRKRRAHAHGPLLRQTARLYRHGPGGHRQPGSDSAFRRRSQRI